MSSGSAPTGNGTDNLSIVLTGQALIQSDTRKIWPELVSNIRPVLEGDVVFTNFESMILEDGDSMDELPPLNRGHYGPVEMLDVLQEMGFNLLATANNHAYDLGPKGVLRVIDRIKERGFGYAGTGADAASAAAPGYIDTPHGKVSLIATATGALLENGAATDTKPGVNELPLVDGIADLDAGHPDAQAARRILDSIAAARENSDIVIAYHHNHDFDKNFVEILQQRLPERLLPPRWMKTWVRRQIDAGADMVVLQGLPIATGLEFYKGRPIFYNMGNFMFQLDVAHKEIFPFDVFQSVVARVEYDGRKLKAISFRPIELTDYIHEEESRILSGIPAPSKGARAHAMLWQIKETSRAWGVNVNIEGDTAVVDLSQIAQARPEPAKAW